MISWEKNPEYPTSFTTCRVCGDEGIKKQAWDRQGSLCLDAKECLNRNKANKKIDDSWEDHLEWKASIPESNSKETVKPINSDLQWFNCDKCHKMWSRPSTRGRPPKICPDCR